MKNHWLDKNKYKTWKGLLKGAVLILRHSLDCETVKTMTPEQVDFLYHKLEDNAGTIE